MLPLSRGGAEMGKIGEIVRDVSPESLARANEDNLAEGLAARARLWGRRARWASMRRAGIVSRAPNWLLRRWMSASRG